MCAIIALISGGLGFTWVSGAATIAKVLFITVILAIVRVIHLCCSENAPHSVVVIPDAAEPRAGMHLQDCNREPLMAARSATAKDGTRAGTNS